MKGLKRLLGGFMALACAILFSQCSGNGGGAQSTQSYAQGGTTADLKVAYVEIDTLLAKYNFWVDLNEVMVKKSENVRLTLNQKAQELQKEQQEFQTKYQNNAFLSQERAQQEYDRINKLNQDLQDLSTKLQNELAEESDKYNLQLQDTIKTFLKEYNKTHGFNLILSNTGLDNLLFADDALNITQEVLDGLNARYAPSKNN